MRVTRLKLANLRVIETAELRFRPGFNLIVGVNGVGKSSVLDALGVCLSAVVKHMNRLRTQAKRFVADDIRVGADALTVECDFRVGQQDHSYYIHMPRETSVVQKKRTGVPREQIYDTPLKEDFVGDSPQIVTGDEPGGRPLGVQFYTTRAVPTEGGPGKAVAAGGISAAYAQAFASRELRLGELAAWLRVQEALQAENAAAGRKLVAFARAVERFLPGYGNLRIESDNGPKLLIDRAKTALEVRQLSEGERGVLALVLDLTRRLAQANPELDDPAAEAGAVVLIDEIDLHLHPKWQRQIARNLAETFPLCQFIATTHSPQVIGEVEHDRIQIIADGQVFSPSHSFGVDSSRVLEEIMDAPPRTQQVQDLLSRLSREIGTHRYGDAHASLDVLIEHLGENDPEVTRARTLLEFMEGER